MPGQIIMPNDDPGRTRYDWLSQEIARLESIINANKKMMDIRHKHIIEAIHTLEKMIIEMNIGKQTRPAQEISKK
jgi:molybdenum-dependent DNA-binding transcriptional regulator ModE